MRIFYLIIFNIFLGLHVYGQIPTKLKNTIYDYGRQKGLQGLYLHLDKTSYVSNDNIWFTGYQLSTIDGIENTMFVTLQNPYSHKIVSSGKFVMQNGVASGSLFIDPAIPPGNYRLLAYTNIELNYMNKPVFQQNITITKSLGDPFSVVKIKEHTQPDKNGNYAITYKVVSERPDVDVRRGKIFYYLNNTDGKDRAKAVTIDDFNEFEVALPQNLSHNSNSLNVALVLGNDTNYFQKNIQLQDSLSITFYPEGGSLVAGMSNKIAFSVWSSMGKISNRKFSLYKNDGELLTINTGAFGMGIFELMPEQNAVYKIKAEENELMTAVFPVIKNGGLSLAVPKAVVEKSVSGNIQSASGNKFVQLVLHNYNEVFKIASIGMSGAQTDFNLNLDDVKSGVAFLTLLDEEGDPVAERAIYIRPEQHVFTTITLDSTLHHSRSKVNLKIKMKDKLGNPVRALFSIASVFSDSYDSTMVTPLSSFYYCSRFASAMTNVPENCFSIPQAKMELLLRTKFWFDYRWNERQDLSPSDTAFNLSKGLSATIRYNGKPLQRPLELMIVREDTTIAMLSTDSFGYTRLYYESLIASYGHKVRFSPLPGGEPIHNFSSSTNENVLDSVLAVIANKSQYIPELTIAAPRQRENITTARNGIVLKTVNIVSARRGYNGMGSFISDACDDYVCQYNILNCANHPFDKRMKAIDGSTYQYYEYLGGPQREVVYHCTDAATDLFFAKINGVWKTREFYSPDYNQFSPEELEAYSTAFWSPQVMTDEGGEATVSFFTNDLLGNMTVHIQGMSTAGPLSGKAFYKVIK